MNVTEVRMEKIPLLLNTIRETALPKVFVLTWGIRIVRVSSEEQCCLEGKYTVRRSMR